MTGISTHAGYIADIRASIQEVYRNSYLRYKYEDINYATKPIPTADIVGNLPTDERELALYIKWFRDTCTLGELTDAWNNPLNFAIKDGFFSCASAGTDGMFGTMDDISQKVPVPSAKPEQQSVGKPKAK